MDVDFVASNSSTTGTTLAWLHTCAGADRLLVVGVEFFNAGGSGTISSITYGAAGLTKVGPTNARNSAANINTEIWYFIAPATGEDTITVTFDFTPNGQVGGSVSFIGAKQSGQPDAFNTANEGNSGTALVGLTVVADGSWILDSVAVFDTTITAMSPQVERWKVTSLATRTWGGSTKSAVSAGATTMSWTLGASNFWAAMAASFAPIIGEPGSKKWVSPTISHSRGDQ